MKAKTSYFLLRGLGADARPLAARQDDVQYDRSIRRTLMVSLLSSFFERDPEFALIKYSRLLD